MMPSICVIIISLSGMTVIAAKERSLGHDSSLSVVCNLGREPIVKEAGLCGGGSWVVVIIRVDTVSLNFTSIILIIVILKEF